MIRPTTKEVARFFDNVKLSEKDVLIIRDIYKNEGLRYTDIAELFGVSPATIGDVVLRKNWKHI